MFAAGLSYLIEFLHKAILPHYTDSSLWSPVPTSLPLYLSTVIFCDILSQTRQSVIVIRMWRFVIITNLTWVWISVVTISHVTPSPSSLWRSDLLDGPGLTDTPARYTASRVSWSDTRQEIYHYRRYYTNTNTNTILLYYHHQYQLYILLLRTHQSPPVTSEGLLKDKNVVSLLIVKIVNICSQRIAAEKSDECLTWHSRDSAATGDSLVSL